MKLFEWKASDRMGDEEIDRQHRELFEIGQELYSALADGRGFDVVEGILARLVRHSNEHFVTEERVMERHRYPLLKAHRQSHQEFARKITDFHRELDDGKKSVVTMIMPALQSWIKTHTQGEDHTFAEFLKEKGEKKADAAGA